jgi:hypothetical protein
MYQCWRQCRVPGSQCRYSAAAARPKPPPHAWFAGRRGDACANNVETPHPVETFHANSVFYFHQMQGFHANPAGQVRWLDFYPVYAPKGITALIN